MKQPMMAFMAVYLKVKHGYVGFVEELPGVTFDGATIEEARRKLRELAEVAFDAERQKLREKLVDRRTDFAANPVAPFAPRPRAHLRIGDAQLAVERKPEEQRHALEHLSDARLDECLRSRGPGCEPSMRKRLHQALACARRVALWSRPAAASVTSATWEP